MSLNELSFQIKGKISVILIISMISSILGLGALFAKVDFAEKRIIALESRCSISEETYSKILQTLIRVDENSKYLKEQLIDLKNSKNSGGKSD